MMTQASAPAAKADHTDKAPDTRTDDATVLFAGGCCGVVAILGADQQEYLDGVLEGGMAAALLLLPGLVFMAGAFVFSRM